MPELPEVETVCRGLSPILKGETLSEVILQRADLRFPFPERFCKLLQGKKVVNVKRRAKYILVIFTDGLILICHLGMSGSFRVYFDARPPIHVHDHVLFRIGDETEVRYHDPRRFGFMALSHSSEIQNHSAFKNIGPEPINPNLDGELLMSLLKGRVGPIKNILLNQKVIAGIGNIYASEALHFAGISPNRKAKNVQGRRAHDLASALVKVLNQAIAAGGATLKDHRTPFGEIGYFQNKLQVYGREGETCKTCLSGSIIKKIVQANRSTFFCPKCQR